MTFTSAVSLFYCGDSVYVLNYKTFFSLLLGGGKEYVL